jgi:RND family efflux transporter MFP subunit
VRARRLALIVLVPLTLPGCRRNPPVEIAPVTGPIGVVTEVVRPETLRSTIAAPGVIQPSAAGDWIIYPPESGRIEELTKSEGDAVQPGDLLVRFDMANLSQDVMARQTDLAEATSRLDAAKAALGRLTALYERGYAPRNDFEGAKNAVTQAETDVLHARQRLENASIAAERGVVKARFAGVIAKKYHNAGDLVNGAISDPVLRVIDPTRVQAAVQVPTSQLGLVLAGQQATVVSAANPAGEPATVASKSAVSDPQAATAEVRIAFASPVTLPVDSPVQAEILLDQRTNVVAVPIRAVLKGNDDARFVFIAGSDGRAHRRDVRTGIAGRDRVEILVGLTAGDRVIVSNLEALTDGAEISVER